MRARCNVSFGREICGDLPSSLRREWIVTNGLGGYASATLAGVATRRYHGLLVAALSPPVGRTVLVGGLVEWALYGGRRYPLSTHEYRDGTIDPKGYTHLRAFRLEGMLPIWEFELADVILEKRVWMPHGANTTCVRYRLIRGTGPVDLEITPLVTYRDFHTLRSGQGWTPEVDSVPGGIQIRAGAVPFRLVVDGGAFTRAGDWYWNFHHREEASRGLDNRSDLYAPGVFRGLVQPDNSVTLVATAEAAGTAGYSDDVESARVRQDQLLRRAGVAAADPVVQQLTLAADLFLVARNAVHGAGKTVIAGYHWFNDWGRDTMISLPGLTLCTGRSEEGAGILREFARYVRDGLLPNNFPDQSAQTPGYNTADASLWYLLALRAHHEATGDDRLVDDLLPVVREILDRHIEGTHYGIGMDPRDSLLRAGAPGVQLTWMDAKVGDWVVTPRAGKPVEINALWYNALRTGAEFLSARRADAAGRYAGLADRVRDSFRARYLRAGACRLADVVDGPDGDDLTIRPNQIFAVSLPFPLLDDRDAAAVVESVGKTLLTTYGLRSLSPDAPAYRGSYGGDVVHRDGAYHQGTVWAWLIGPYVDAHYRVHRNREAAIALLRPFEHHLFDAGLGTISEIFDGDAPHVPRGCIAQAWSVAEILRVWRSLGPNSFPEGR